jgi:hypothetical protein
LLDPKPLGAFCEYTLRPLIEDSVELINKLEEAGVNPKTMFSAVWKLYLFDKFVSAFTSIFCLTILCLTVLSCLRYAH